jgi:hypothetical protein
MHSHTEAPLHSPHPPPIPNHCREQLAGVSYATESPRQPKLWDKVAKNLQQGLSLPPGALNMKMDIRGLKNVFTNKRGAATAAGGEA